jgi:hypothetical protein
LLSTIAQRGPFSFPNGEDEGDQLESHLDDHS